MMKRIMLLFAIMSFIAVYSVSYASSTISPVDKVLIKDKKPCPKCGSGKCDRSCEKAASCNKKVAEAKNCPKAKAVCCPKRAKAETDNNIKEEKETKKE